MLPYQLNSIELARIQQAEWRRYAEQRRMERLSRQARPASHTSLRLRFSGLPAAILWGRRPLSVQPATDSVPIGHTGRGECADCQV